MDSEKTILNMDSKKTILIMDSKKTILIMDSERTPLIMDSEKTRLIKYLGDLHFRILLTLLSLLFIFSVVLFIGF